MSTTSPFAIHKALIGIGGEPKSVKKLRSGDILIETISAVQTKSFLYAKSFLDSPANVTPHKSLNSSRGVISEPDLLTTSEAKILEVFSNQGVIQTNILPSASSIKPTTQIESALPEPISSAVAPDNSLNTSASSLSADTCPFPTISNKFAALQSSISLSESATTKPNSELSNTSKVPQNVKQNYKNRRKRTKSRNRNKNG
ncbi:putative RNA-directed DNA polymerase from transposon BS [Trichonephila clavipes]|uniref:Putative RNA-directed DNA polymerase from transposon BS n=1 Tax=Trichonephila clavipes TaxID=2585209 RepID=A0A8X6SU18_TRICX|nr:putative RNA-directed DNA polymerase from transposon BS [Trichonephila clavipes]